MSFSIVSGHPSAQVEVPIAKTDRQNQKPGQFGERSQPVENKTFFYCFSTWFQDGNLVVKCF